MRLMQNGGDKTQIAVLEAICRIGEPIATPNCWRSFCTIRVAITRSSRGDSCDFRFRWLISHESD